MGENKHYFSIYGKPPIYQLLVSMLIIFGVGIILLLVFLLAGTQVFDLKLDIVENLSSSVSRENIGFLKYLMISQDISLFIVPSIIIMSLMKSGQQTMLTGMKLPGAKDIILVVVLAFCIFPITSFTGQLNAGLDLPEWFSGVERWMIEKEDNATDLINLLIISNTFWVMILNLIMIAVIPAIGEEFIFRGVFQKIFYKLFKSGHLAIWVTAFIFSAIHFQFYGFIPRFTLGLVFGYLFLWSGTLWLPVISHFVNNAVPVIGSYIQGWDKLNTPMDVSLSKQLIGLPLPIIIGIGILFYFRHSFRKKSETDSDQSLISDF